MRNTIIVCKWHKELIRALKRYNYKIILVSDAFDIQHEPIEYDLIDHFFSVSSFDSLDELTGLASVLAEKFKGVKEVISHTEYSQLGTGILREILNIPPSFRNVTLTRSKYLMKNAIASKGILHARGRLFSSLSEIRSHANEISRTFRFPIVLKPVNGQGTRLTIKVENPDAIIADIDRLVAFEDRIVHSKCYVVEEFISGTELHVDAVWKEGQPWFLGVSQYYAPNLSVCNADLTSGSIFLPELLHQDLYREILDLHLKVNDALEIRNGVTHMEVFIDSEKNLHFGEIATRFGGGGISAMIRTSCGFSLHEIFVEALIAEAPVSIKDKGQFSSWINLRPRLPGKIVALPSEDLIRSLPGVAFVDYRKKVGDLFFKNSASEYCCLVGFSGSSLTDLVSLRDRLERECLLRTE